LRRNHQNRGSKGQKGRMKKKIKSLRPGEREEESRIRVSTQERRKQGDQTRGRGSKVARTLGEAKSLTISKKEATVCKLSAG